MFGAAGQAGKIDTFLLIDDLAVEAEADVAAPGARPKRAGVEVDAGLLLEFAAGGVAGVLARLERAAGQLPPVAARGLARVTDLQQQDPAPGVDQQDPGGQATLWSQGHARSEASAVGAAARSLRQSSSSLA